MSDCRTGVRRPLVRRLPGVATGDPGSCDLPDFRTLSNGPCPPTLLEAMEREKASGAGTSKWSNRLLLPSYSHPGTSRAGGPGHRGGAGVYSTEEEPDDVLPGFVMEALAEHVEKWPPGDFELIFLDRNRHPVRRSTFYRRWRQATERAGLPGFKVHNLRHTAPHWRWQAEPILST